MSTTNAATAADPPGGIEASVRVVGLGASAGGLEPLKQFLSGVPPDSGLAYVVVQHMDPDHKTMLAELLQHATAMPVCEAVESQRIEPNSVYVISPNSQLTVRAGALHVSEPVGPRGHRQPIDSAFRSLAAEFGVHAIGVVLSGMGSDGTEGLLAIRSQGGVTCAQLPESAQFDAMPKSAIASGAVDICALPAELPARVLEVIGGRSRAVLGAVADANRARPALETIVALLRAHTHHDLSLYKSKTLLRRIARRLAVHRLPTLDAYARFLEHNPQELDLLFKEMLIGVTSFFRDPEVWREISNTVLPELVERHPQGAGPLRAWVVGCSTGEEAYSLAISFSEALEQAGTNRATSVQIFATDLNADAISTARAGRFGTSIANDLTPERLARYFVARPGGYQVVKPIRDMVLFAQHDVIADPPFTRLDLISCRNLMIYFDAALQRRLIPLFHYSLRPGGTLLLGGAETIGRAQSLFSPIHHKSRLFRRSNRADPRSTLFFPTARRTALRTAPLETPVANSNTPPANLHLLADQLLLQSYSPPAVLVNGDGDILYINGRTGRYLEPAAGKANWNIHVMARPSIRTQLAVALREAVKDRKVTTLRRLRLDDETSLEVDITVQAVLEPKAFEGMAMIVFRDVVPAPGGRKRPSDAPATAEPGVYEELRRAHDEIRALRQEMNASQEELQAANEELQSTNEELQSANEELTTAAEESRSMVEELQTINGELQAKLDELALAQSDMQNLLNSTNIATLFLDDQLNVRRFTDQVARVIHLREGDIGRPLSDLATTLLYPELHSNVQETMRTLAPCERQIATTDGHWFNVRIMPYRTLTNVIQGVVITFVDITIAKELELRLRNA